MHKIILNILRVVARIIGVPRKCPHDGGVLYDYYGNSNTMKCPNCTRTYVWVGGYLEERE